MYSLPTTVKVKDREFHIRDRGDYRMVLDCFSALQDEELSEDYRVLASLLIFYNEFTGLEDIQQYEEYIPELVKEMFRFINAGQENSPGADAVSSVIDWEGDSQMICSAISNVANT